MECGVFFDKIVANVNIFFNKGCDYVNLIYSYSNIFGTNHDRF